MVLEARRPDCNVQTAFLFERAAEALGEPGLREVATNILDFLFRRSSLRDRSSGTPYSGLRLWAHPAPRPSWWADDMAWVITILCTMARHGRPGLAAPAVETARVLHAMVQRYFADVGAARLRPPTVGGYRPGHPHEPALDRPPYHGIRARPGRGSAHRLLGRGPRVLRLLRAAGPPGFDEASRRAACRHPWSISEYAYLSLCASVCAGVFHDDAVRAALRTSVAILLENQLDQGNFPSEHYESPAAPNLVDLVYTQNWATLGLLHAARVLDDAACRRAADRSLELQARIQDASPQPWLAGCWRGLYDASAGLWGGGDLSEGGANSIYSGWTNAPIALAFLFSATGESFFALVSADCPTGAGSVHWLMPTQALPGYTWRGARALVLLHEESMHALLAAWRRAKAAHIRLPPSDNPAYASLDTVMHHALKAARNMLTWICEKLELPDPGINETPDASRLDAEADAYVEHLLARWRLPFVQVDAKQMEAIHKDRGGHDTSLLAGLEHAVLHPQRHRFQLEELLEGN